MMLGTIAAPARGGGVYIPGWLPAGATAFLDFVNGVYWAGGASRVVSNVLGDGPDTVQAGGGFNPDAIVSRGLLICNNGNLDAETSEAWTSRPCAAGSFKDDVIAALAMGLTIVFDLDFVNPPYGTFFLISDNDGKNDSVDYIYARPVGSTYDSANLYDQGDLDFYGATGVLEATGLHKVAFTLNRDAGGGSYEYAISIDGGAATTSTVSYQPSFSVNTICLGHDGDDSAMFDIVYIRSITLYPAKLPADLSALTDIPTA